MKKNLKVPHGESGKAGSQRLRELVNIWASLQQQIDMLQTNDDLPINSARMIEFDELEETLQKQQDRVTREIIDTDCASLSDLLLKLDLWQRSQRLGSADLSGFSLTEQIGLSINTDAFR